MEKGFSPFMKQSAKSGREPALRWHQLSLIGVGSVIGAGFFLGTGVSIRIAGPSLMAGYLLGGFVAYLVFAALAEMTVHDPQPGSFRTYARKAFGPSMGFISGWIYWVAGVLIMSSEIVALSIFSRYWFPNEPLWIFSILYSILGLSIILLGTRNFGKIESVFGLVKLSALLVFILFGVLAAAGFIRPEAGGIAGIRAGTGLFPLMPNGWLGFWSAMIFVLFSYGGIEVLGVTAGELKNKNDAPKAGSIMLVSLTLIYTLSLYFVFRLTSWSRINESRSPFVTALAPFDLPFLDSLFNLIIISAAFSTMVGALFTVTRVMVSLSQDGDAPRSLSKFNRRGIPLRALLLSAVGLAAAITFSYFLPNTVYEYITTAAGILLIANWAIILSAHIRNRPAYTGTGVRYHMFGYPYSSYTGIGLIAWVIAGSLLHRGERIGFYVGLGLIAFISIACAVRKVEWTVGIRKKAR